MALSELEQLELEKLEREKERRTTSPQQKTISGQGEQQTQQPNVIQQLLSSSADAVGSFVGGVIEPPIRATGRAGQAIETAIASKISGKQESPMNYSVPLPQTMGGNIEIKPPENYAQLVGPVIGSTLAMLGIKGIMNPKGVSKVIKYDNALKQARQAKQSIDSVRSTLGQAKEIALQEVKDLPVEFSWKDIPSKAVNALKNPDYGIQFDAEGKIINTIGNLDKVKMALQDIPTTKDFVEAGKMTTRAVINYAREVRDTIVSTVRRAGKPQLAKALKDYHDFMDDYNVINDHLVDKGGHAMANKLKATFRLTAEPAIKESWNNVAKLSPELKSIVRSRKNRELLKALLITAPTIESGKRIITGKW